MISKARTLHYLTLISFSRTSASSIKQVLRRNDSVLDLGVKAVSLECITIDNTLINPLDELMSILNQATLCPKVFNDVQLGVELACPYSLGNM